MIMFTLIPQNYQVLWNNGVNLCWNMVLSIMANSKIKLVAEAKQHESQPVAEAPRIADSPNEPATQVGVGRGDEEPLVATSKQPHKLTLR